MSLELLEKPRIDDGTGLGDPVYTLTPLFEGRSVLPTIRVRPEYGKLNGAWVDIARRLTVTKVLVVPPDDDPIRLPVDKHIHARPGDTITIVVDLEKLKR